MSVQELLNLILTQDGPVDPRTCLQCATIRKQARQAKTPKAANYASHAMYTHKVVAHPDDTRTPTADIPGPVPRVV